MINDGLQSTTEPSPNTFMPIPKQSTKGSATKKAPATKEASGINGAKEKPRKASTARNAIFLSIFSATNKWY